MRVVCQNCGATYKIPDTKLVKEVNKATCRKCGYRMMIRRPSSVVSDAEVEAVSEEAATKVEVNPLTLPDGAMLEADTRIEKAPENEWSEEAPTQVQVDPEIPIPPNLPKETEKDKGGAVPAPDTTAPKISGPEGSSSAPQLDMMLALIGTFASACGALLLATNTGDSAPQRIFGLGIALYGALSCLFLLVTGNLWRQRGSVGISVALALVLASGGTGLIELILHGGIPMMSGSDGSDDAAPLTPIDDQVAAATANEISKDAVMPSAGGEDTQAGGSAENALADAAEDKPSDPEVPVSAAAIAAQQRDGAEEEAQREREEAARNSRRERQSAEQERRASERDYEREQAAAEEARRRQQEAQRQREEQARRNAEEAQRQREEAERAAAAPAGPPKMKTLPLTVVDTLIRSNLSIKKCFYQEKQRTGQMPKRVTVKFTILPTGKVTTARVITSEFKGGPLDSCLGRSFRSIQFPGFEGEALSMTYPFVL